MTDYLMTTIRSIAASFPVGSSVVNAWNEIQTGLEQERLESLVSELAERLNALEPKICKSKDEMGRVFCSTLNYVKKDPQGKKVPLYAGCLLEYGVSDVTEIEIVNLIQELETINAHDIDVLKRLAPSGRIDDALSLNENSQHSLISQNQVSIKKLESKALIFPGSASPTNLQRLFDHPNVWPFSFFTQEFVVPASGQLLLAIWSKYYTA